MGMKTGRKRWQIAGICILLIILGAGLGSLYENSRRGKYEVGQLEILIDGTDKARYAPGEEAVITASVRNLTEKNADDILLEMNVYHLGEAVYSQQQSLAIAPGEEKGLSLNWQPPDTDYQGYLICLKLTDSKGNYIAQDTTGIDISSDWVKFPRYGYLCDYGEEENTEEKIAQMNRYHINAIEYYDWHALHHEPIPEEVTRTIARSMGGLVRTGNLWGDGEKLYSECAGQEYGQYGI